MDMEDVWLILMVLLAFAFGALIGGVGINNSWEHNLADFSERANIGVPFPEDPDNVAIC